MKTIVQNITQKTSTDKHFKKPAKEDRKNHEMPVVIFLS